MAECLGSLVYELNDLYGNINIVDGDSGAPLAASLGTGAAEDHWWIETDEEFLLRGSDREISAYVRFELWSGPPPVADSSWGRSWSGRLHVPSGKVQARENFDSEDQKSFDLGCADVEWSMQVHAKTLRNSSDLDFPSDIFRVDLFKLRFWRFDHR
ncbi:hypothetical protein ACQPZZ_36050 [Microbispora sp. CA-135349]|uniref:hypothetical protein n=1 Tax=Microbispora sp. CA-135349 TaxID=3239953 RepID=UPI003D8C1358